MNASSKTQLPDTLARRVQFLRESRDLTQNQLAKKAAIPMEMIRDIEAGLEMFLAPAVRQKLARALRVRSGDLKAVEKRPTVEEEHPEAETLRQEGRALLRAIRRAPQAEHRCPECAALLNVRVFQRRDLEENLLETVKVHCPNCLFRLESE